MSTSTAQNSHLSWFRRRQTYLTDFWSKELTDEACRKRRDGSGGKNLHGTFLHVFLSSPVEYVTGTACAPDVASIGPTQPTSHVSNRFTETDVDPKGRRPEVRSVKGSWCGATGSFLHNCKSVAWKSAFKIKCQVRGDKEMPFVTGGKVVYCRPLLKDYSEKFPITSEGNEFKD